MLCTFCTKCQCALFYYYQWYLHLNGLQELETCGMKNEKTLVLQAVKYAGTHRSIELFLIYLTYIFKIVSNNHRNVNNTN